MTLRFDYGYLVLKKLFLRLTALFATLTASAGSHAAPQDTHMARFAERLSRIGCHRNDAGREPLLRVLTLNAAHGRRDGPNQIFLNKANFRQNLEGISRLLRASRADIVALQEVDGPSAWSGRFDHAVSMADEADYPWHYRADHATSWLFRYGTAVLSRLPFNATRTHRFAASPPTPRKGFVVSEVSLPTEAFGIPDFVVDVLSVHFDFLSRRTQANQVSELIDTLQERDNPAIVLGDFNSDWQRPDSTVRELTDRTGLLAFEPDAENLATHQGKRIDWILISDEFRFENYRVLPDVVSDHQPVYAEIGINPESNLSLECRPALQAATY